jgi:hypothetical protein
MVYSPIITDKLQALEDKIKQDANMKHSFYLIPTVFTATKKIQTYDLSCTIYLKQRITTLK